MNKTKTDEVNHKPKEIVVGEYQHGRSHPETGFRYSANSSNGTNRWDDLIEKLDYDNVEFEVVLREKQHE